MKESAEIKMFRKIKDVDTMFNMVCVKMYFAGQFDMKMPVEESRAIFKIIKERLAK